MYKQALTLLLATVFLPGCSVAMAAKKSGHSLEQVHNACTRTQMMRLSSHVLSSEKNSSGQLVESYKIEKKRGSSARAVMHGILDLSTCCVWEIAGTPIEGSLSKKESFAVKVTYEKDSDRVEKIELI